LYTKKPKMVGKRGKDVPDKDRVASSSSITPLCDIIGVSQGVELFCCSANAPLLQKHKISDNSSTLKATHCRVLKYDQRAKCAQNQTQTCRQQKAT
jgi:hypothetical protein